MANTKISDLTALTGANTAADDVFVVVDTSSNSTNKITRAELITALTTGNFKFADTKQAIFGDGDDLTIEHNGSNSFIRDTGDGDLYIRGNNSLFIQNVDGTENKAQFITDGAVNLMYDGTTRIATSSTGATVTGVLTTTGNASIGGNATITGDLTVNGTTTTVNSNTIEVTNNFVFEGSTDDDNELTLTAGDPTADRTVTLPDATTTLVGTDATQTLTNKTIDASQLSGTVANARLDAQLQDVAGLAVTDGNFIVGNGSNFVAESGATARASMGVTIGTDVQAYDAGLQSISGLTTSANQLIYATGSDTYTVTSLTAFGRSLIDDADASAARTTLGLGTAATQTVGTSANNVVQLDGSARLPAVDGSQLTNISFTETDPTALAFAIALG